MSTPTKTPATNGAAKATPEPAKLTVATTVVKPVKKDDADQDLPSLEDRLHRLNVLFGLQTKYNKYTESLHKLGEFEIKKDGERSFIRISDDSRNDFSTYHPEIVQEVVDFLKLRIKARIKDLEPLLKW